MSAQRCFRCFGIMSPVLSGYGFHIMCDPEWRQRNGYGA